MSDFTVTKLAETGARRADVLRMELSSKTVGMLSAQPQAAESELVDG